MPYVNLISLGVAQSFVESFIKYDFLYSLLGIFAFMLYLMWKGSHANY